MKSLTKEINEVEDQTEINVIKDSMEQSCDPSYPAGFHSTPKKDQIAVLIKGDRSNTFEVVGYENHPADNITIYTDKGTISLDNENVKIKFEDHEINLSTKISIDSPSIELTSSADILINGATVTTTGDVVTKMGVSLDKLDQKVKLFKQFYGLHVHTSTAPGNPTSPPTVPLPPDPPE